jgi:hypothetical protein
VGTLVATRKPKKKTRRVVLADGQAEGGGEGVDAAEGAVVGKPKEKPKKKKKKAKAVDGMAEDGPQ